MYAWYNALKRLTRKGLIEINTLLKKNDLNIPVYPIPFDKKTILAIFIFQKS
jgi:hypothetical protein